MASMGLAGQPGELRMTIEVMRKETGAVEQYEVVGKLTPEDEEKLGLKPEPAKEN